METSIITQPRAEWLPKRARGRRESKVAYRNAPGHAVRNSIGGLSTYASSPEEPYSRNSDRFQLQTPAPAGQTLSVDLRDYFNVPRSPTGNAGLGPVVHQNIQDDSSWYAASAASYTLSTLPPNSPQNMAVHTAQSPRRAISRISTDPQDMSWTNMSAPSPAGASDLMVDMAMYNMDFGSFGSFGSHDSMVLPTPSTANSEFTDGYMFPSGARAEQEAPDLALANNWYNIEMPLSPSSPDTFQFENDLVSMNPNLGGYGNVYSTEPTQWPPPAIAQPQPKVEDAALFSPTPWDSQNAQLSRFQYSATSGIVTFEPQPSTAYGTHMAQRRYLDTAQPTLPSLGPEPISSPCDHGEMEGWVVTSNASSSYAASHGSPRSHGSPASHPPSPPQHELDHHSHIFDSQPGVPKAKLTRGRQRGLTALEKKQARDVRDAKACWACHISKTKCSPCSPGKPCEQCARLAGKRRFCMFNCFNDPLEALSTFMVPNYLMGHFTRANVENFVTRNASSWGTECLVVQMTWGYRKLLRAEVVALVLKSNSTDMAFQDQTISQGDGRSVLVRKQSPPIGIPLAAMDDMQNIYTNYIQQIVQGDLAEYVPVAYTDQESELPEELLGAVCNYYSAGLATDSESDILRRAIEMHVTAVILERSLILDEHSLRKVERHLNQEYPPESAPRCAQRQIKLAFFILQQRRINRILKDWGSMMWATNTSVSKDKEWATAFSVFILLILVMDKTLGAAYYFCEGRIMHQGHEPNKERSEFQKLVRLTQKDLFERCKEIFHWKFKTRKGGKEACNPIRDGIDAFQGKSKSLDGDVAAFVGELQDLVRGYDENIRAHCTVGKDADSEFADAGRLACIFLDDFLGRSGG